MALRSRCNAFLKPLLFLLCVAPYASFSLVLDNPIPGPGTFNIAFLSPVTIVWDYSPTDDPKFVTLVVNLIDTKPRVSLPFAIRVNVSAGNITKALPGLEVVTDILTNLEIAAVDVLNPLSVLAQSPAFRALRNPSTPTPLTTLETWTSISSAPSESSATNSAKDAASTSLDPLPDPSAAGDPGSGSNFAPSASSFPDGVLLSSSSPLGMPGATSFTFSSPSSAALVPSTTVPDPDSTNLPHQGTTGPEASKRMNIGAILGGVLGGLAFLSLSVYFLSRHVQRLCGQASDRESIFRVTPLNNDRTFRPFSSIPEKGRIIYASSSPTVPDSSMTYASDSYTHLADSQGRTNSFHLEPQSGPQRAHRDERISLQLYGQPPPSYDADRTP